MDTFTVMIFKTLRSIDDFVIAAVAHRATLKSKWSAL